MLNAIFKKNLKKLDYKKKSLKKLQLNESYEEIDARLASGWYVDSLGNNKKKVYKTKEVSFTIHKKLKNWKIISKLKKFLLFPECSKIKLSHFKKKVS